MNKTKAFQNILTNYQQKEKSIVQQLYFQYDPHGTTIGTFRENVWKKLFESVVPKKFVVERSIFIVDSEGDVSNEVDLAIIDQMYTPYIFQQDQLKFVPIEAVSAAIECKSTSATKEGLKNWANSITDLKMSHEGIARMHTHVVPGTGVTPTQTALRPILIYCHLDGAVSGSVREYFDMEIHASEKPEEKLHVQMNTDRRTLDDYYRALNHGGSRPEGDRASGIEERMVENLAVKYGGEEVSILSLNLKLNQLLMLINNPPLFPHYAYAQMFNDVEG